MQTSRKIMLVAVALAVIVAIGAMAMTQNKSPGPLVNDDDQSTVVEPVVNDTTPVTVAPEPEPVVEPDPIVEPEPGPVVNNTHPDC
jgi:hypothetical protein